MADNPSDCDILNSRVLEHPPERVFEAFQDPDLLAKWWGPQGFTNTFRTFDFQPGGEWIFTMHSPDGHNFENESRFLEINAPSQVVIEHVCAPRFVLQVALEEAPGGTLLTWRQTFETAEMRDNVLKYAGRANEENLDRLAAVLANGSPS